MDRIKCFIECLIPVTACNLRCGYCYVIQRGGRSMKVPGLEYPVKTIKQALTRERFGGTCYFSICGAGETLVPPYTLEIVKALLENGHYVNVTNNGTMTKRFKELANWPKDELERLHFAFSLHYNELNRLGRLDSFFENVNFVRSLGCSFLVQLNLCDEYLPHVEEIKKICLDRIGALPQIAATRKEEALDSRVLFDTELSDEEYIAKGGEFCSPLFDFTVKNFNVKRGEFCYAGSWAFQLDLLSGKLRPCYHSSRVQNVYADVDAPIVKRPVGRSCGSLFCMNSSHFMSLGVIPSIETPTYADLRDRPEAGWYSERMRGFLSGKLVDDNVEAGALREVCCTACGRCENMYWKLRARVGQALRAIGIKKQ